MSVIYIILLGILQGITEFLPVSSFGHVSILGGALGVEHSAGVLFEVLLHVGTLAGVFYAFQKDLRRVGAEFIGMLMDIVGNCYLFIHNKRTGDDLRYAPVVKGTYRKLTALLVVTCIPTAILGYTARRLAAMAEVSPLIPGIGLLLTGVFLIVVDFSGAGGNKTPREAGYDHAMWIGICQGISVFPGISRCGLTVGIGLFCGFSRKFAVKYSFLASVPAIIGSFFVEIPGFWTSDISIGLGFAYILGMIAAGVTGYFTIRFLMKILQSIRLRYFAVYCFIAGAIGLAVNFG